MTSFRLPAPARGADAVVALGPHLSEVAQAYGMDPQRLSDLLRTQPSLGIDQEGALVFVCAAPDPTVAPPVRSDNTGEPSPLPPRTSDAAIPALQLHSLPGASRVIYLDFDGHTTTGTRWNSTLTGGAPIVSQPFDRDGDPTTFNAAEQLVIQRIWQRVAEDYAPFNVDVTTEDPGLEALRKTTVADLNYGVRVVVSPTNWYSTAAGGVSYVGAFNWNSDAPAFVFTQQLANQEKYIAEACTHETGHALGLFHDGLTGSMATEYYEGQGSWAPIMGNSYYRPITQFSRGEYQNANNTENDLSIIATYIPLTTDDHGNTLATASALAGPAVAEGGTIESSSDVDVFRFETGAGQISFALNGTSPEPNLDIKAELLNSDGLVLQSSDPPALNGSILTTVSAGVYYLRISGVGAGNPLTTGYSNYGSIGNYIITGTLVEVRYTLTVASTNPASGVAITASPLDTSGLGNGSTSFSRSYNRNTSVLLTAPLTATDTYFQKWQRDGVDWSVARSTAVTMDANHVLTAIYGPESPYITSITPGTLRNDFSGWVGMQITVGSAPLIVSQLGRLTVAGNTGLHPVKLVRASDGSDVPGGATTLAMSGGTVGQFHYNTLSSPVTLSAATTYWLVSLETAGGDRWYDSDATVTTTGAAADIGYVWEAGPGVWGTYAIANRGAVPLNFKYTRVVAPAGTPFVTNFVPGTLRNDFGGWVGMQVTIGANALQVAEVGRIVVPGNTASHAVKWVRASDGADVPGGGATVATSAGQAGQFQYSTLDSPVALSAGTTYWLVSLETAGGDRWCDSDATVTTTGAALNIGYVWSAGPGVWGRTALPNRGAIPVNFRYTTIPPPPATPFVTTVVPGTLRNDFGGWVGMQIRIGPNPLQVSHLGRVVIAGNSGSHTVKLIKASDGTDVPGGGTTVLTSLGVAGQFQYSTLNSPVTLAAATTYWLVSLEVAGGDRWYDSDATVTTTGVASDIGYVWSAGPGLWGTTSIANRGAIPVNFKY